MIKPLDIDQGYRMFIKYRFDWRPKLGKATCDCDMVLEVYRPWIGWHWEHEPNCAIEKHLRRYPGILNFVEYSSIIAHTG